MEEEGEEGVGLILELNLNYHFDSHTGREDLDVMGLPLFVDDRGR